MIAPPALHFGHAFGTDFSLPLPLWLFIYAGIVTVLLSFALFAMLYDSKDKVAPTSTPQTEELPIKDLSLAGKSAAVVLLLLTIASGLFGSQAVNENFSVPFFWVIFLVGFTYVTAMFGNIWRLVNPFKAIVEGLERIIGKLFRPVPPHILPYPKKLSYYPALISYFVIISLELVFDGFAETPRHTSLLLLAYLAVTVIGAILFGKKDWFRYADFFSVFFRLVAKLSPIVYTTQGISIRQPFEGLLKPGVKNAGLLLFVLFMLASTSFDGFTETKQYSQIKELLPGFIADTPYIYGVLMLLLSLGLLYGLYVAFLALTKKVVSTKYSVRELCYTFALSLVPIAIGYNLAHYLTYLLLNGQAIVGPISDPFGLGWNIFGTADYRINTTFLSPYTTWYLQVASIIAGHVVAVYVAHRIAFMTFGSQRKATISQLPIVALMVLYTTASLWIIAQPVYIAQERAKLQREKELEFFQVLREPPIPTMPLPPQP